MLIRIKMDKGISTIDDTHNKLINKISKLKKPIIGISFGSPYLPSYDKLDSYICTYGYGSITFKAATRAATQLVANQQLVQLLATQELQARAACMEYECNQGDHNFMGWPDDSAYQSYKPYQMLRR